MGIYFSQMSVIYFFRDLAVVRIIGVSVIASVRNARVDCTCKFITCDPK